MPDIIYKCKDGGCPTQDGLCCKSCKPKAARSCEEKCEYKYEKECTAMIEVKNGDGKQ